MYCAYQQFVCLTYDFVMIETVLKCSQSNCENCAILRETQMQGCGLDLCFKEEMVSNIQVLTLVVLKAGRS